MKELNKKIISAFIFIFLALLPEAVLAENKIDVKYVTGKEIEAEKVFNAQNIYPGWVKSKIIRIENESERDSVDVFLQFESKNDSALGDMIKIYVIRIPDNSYRIGGVGDHWSFNQAKSKNLYIDKLKPQESRYYKIKIKFDRNADNTYQNMFLKFDLDFKIKSRAGNSLDEKTILENQERNNFTGSSDDDIEPKIVHQENAPAIASENSHVEGAQDKNECLTWPTYVWVMALIFYAFIFNLNSDYGKDSRKNRLFWQAIFTALAIFIWYHFDICKTFIWFPIAIFAIAAISYQYVLHGKRK